MSQTIAVELSQAVDASMDHHCGGMIMVPVEGRGVDPMMGDDGATSGSSQQSFKSMQDCDYLCQFFRGMSPFDAAESMPIASSLLLRDGDTYLSRFVSPPMEVHFRPPINA